MDINDIFKFGQYKSLSLIDVYQGTKDIDREILKGYLEFCYLDKTLPKSNIFEFFELQIGVKEINVIPYIFNEEKPESMQNRIAVGDLTNILNVYFNNYFSKNLLEIIPSFQHFNRDNGPSIIGGDPEYISWLLKNNVDFYLSKETKMELEKKIVHKFIGVKIQKTTGLKNLYNYEPIFKEEFHNF